MADLTKPLRIPTSGGAPGSGTGSPAPDPAAAGPAKPVRGYPSMFEPNHFVNGVQVNKAPY